MIDTFPMKLKILLENLLFWLFELYQRIKLFPLWIKYNHGLTEESELKNKIIHLATEMKLEKRWAKDIIRYAESEFSKKGLEKTTMVIIIENMNLRQLILRFLQLMVI